MAKEYVPKVWENYKTPILDEDLNHIENGIKAATDSVISEQTARETADTAIKQSLATEKTARETADSTLQRNIESEASARETADNAINASLASHGSRLNALESYTIGVDSEGYIGVTYNGK